MKLRTANIIFIVLGLAIGALGIKGNLHDSSRANDAAKNYIEVDANNVDSANDGKLVTAKGELRAGSTFYDADFNISIEGVRVERIVEMYQWIEDCDSDGDCNYDHEWRSELVSSSAGHSNPDDMRYRGIQYTADNVTLGARLLQKDLLEKLTINKDYSIAEDAIFENGFTLQEGYITNASNISSPKVGDLRIKYRYAPNEAVTVMAQQAGTSFVPFKVGDGEIYDIVRGEKQGSEMVSEIAHGKSGFRYFMIIAGVILVVFGIVGKAKK